MKVKQWVAQATKCLAGLLAFISMPVLADLPKLEDPSRGAGKGIFETSKNYMYDGFIFGGLIVSTIAFFVVAINAIGTYKEVTSGKGSKTWGDFGMQIVVGVILILCVIWLITKASEIL